MCKQNRVRLLLVPAGLFLLLFSPGFLGLVSAEEDNKPFDVMEACILSECHLSSFDKAFDPKLYTISNAVQTPRGWVLAWSAELPDTGGDFSLNGGVRLKLTLTRHIYTFVGYNKVVRVLDEDSATPFFPAFFLFQKAWFFPVPAASSQQGFPSMPLLEAAALSSAFIDPLKNGGSDHYAISEAKLKEGGWTIKWESSKWILRDPGNGYSPIPMVRAFTTLVQNDRTVLITSDDFDAHPSNLW